MVTLYYIEEIGPCDIGIFPLDFKTDGYYYVRGFSQNAEFKVRTLYKSKSLKESVAVAKELVAQKSQYTYYGLMIDLKRAKRESRYYPDCPIPATSMYNTIGTVEGNGVFNMIRPSKSTNRK